MKKEEVLAILLGIDALLIYLHLVVPGDALWGRFNLDAEIGIGAWVTQLLLYSAGALAVYIGLRDKRKKSAQAYGWFVIGFVLVYLSLDESTAMHEMVAEPVRQLLNIDKGPWFFAWTIPAFIVVGLVGLSLLNFAYRLPNKIRLLLLLSAFVYIGGAAGVEMFSGLYWTQNNFVFDDTYRLLNAIEEGLEIAGASLTIFALLAYLEPGSKRQNLRK